MTPEPLTEEAVFQVARKISATEARTDYLRQVCADKDDLRERVEDLLRAYDEEQSFLESPAVARTIDMPAMAEAPGTDIGHYKLLEQIGEGGFGIVYMAEQQRPVRRKVALKVLKPGMDTRQVVARFEAERQALALMDHPNIARVFDGGTTESGRPYFVMELVKGVPITDYCNENQLTPCERLELFIALCQAVQHAHQKGIIHRDLKPSNVMITVHDTVPAVKVIDFGVAKALGQELTEKTLFTGFAQMVGTPLYMSPEQAGQSGLDIDTRSDVYSLGVLLYELLTGTTPFSKERLKQAAYDEIRRIIREEEPPRPSVRISTLRNAETATRTHGPANRKPPFPAVLGELDWIVMKALEKDRNRRYDSAGALAQDIERHLRDDPVQACPPSSWYRFRKFARRNKSALATASVVGLAVLLALATLTVSTVLIANALEAETRAKDELAHTLERERQTLADERREAYFQRIAGAHRELSVDNLGRALELLDACPHDLRDWEWRYLMRLCRVAPLVLSDDTEMNGLAFSPDGDRLASAGGDGTIKIRNSRTGDVVQTLENAHSNSVVAVTFHPDAEHLASVGADRRVKVWDLTTEEELFNEPCDVGRKFGTAYTVAFSPDGRQLAAASEGAVRIWDLKHPQFSHTLPAHEFHSIPVAFSRDGRLATAIGEGRRLELWDAETGRLLRAIPKHRGPFGALAFSPDGKWLASASYGRSVKLSNSTTGELLHQLDLHTGNVECVAFSPDGKLLASGGEDKTVRVWDATTGSELLGLRGHTGKCACVAFSPDGQRLASASTDGTIRFWDATPLRGDEGQEALTFAKHDGEIRSVAFSPDESQRVASAGDDGIVKVWDAATGETSVEFNRHAVVVFCLAWQPDGERIAAAGSYGGMQTVKVWDSRTGQEPFKLQAVRSAGPYLAVAFSPGGRYLVTGHANGAVEVWDARTGREVGTLDTHGREVRGVVFSRDGQHLASSSDGVVKLWDATRLHENQEARTLPARVPGASLNMAFSPDGRRLATGGEQNTVIIWDVETREKLENLQTLWGQHSGEVYAVAFSPDEDGRWIATAGEDSAVKVWDSRTGKLIHSFRGHTRLVSSLAFSPDGRRLVSGSRDKTVKVWDMTQLNDSKRKP